MSGGWIPGCTRTSLRILAGRGICAGIDFWTAWAYDGLASCLSSCLLIFSSFWKILLVRPVEEEEIKDRSIAEHGFSERDLALVRVKGAIAKSRFKSFIRLWNLFAVSEYSLLFFDQSGWWKFESVRRICCPCACKVFWSKQRRASDTSV